MIVTDDDWFPEEGDAYWCVNCGMRLRFLELPKVSEEEYLRGWARHDRKCDELLIEYQEGQDERQES